MKLKNKKMKIKTSSWHYNLLSRYYSSPTNLCSYFWSVNFAMIRRTIEILIYPINKLFKISNIRYMWFYSLSILTIPIFFYTLYVMLIMHKEFVAETIFNKFFLFIFNIMDILGGLLVFVWILIILRFFDELSQKNNSSYIDIVKNYLKAKKERVCSRIEYVK